MADEVVNPHFHPEAGKTPVDPRAGDPVGTPLDNGNWSDAELAQLTDAMGSVVGGDENLDLAEAPKPSKRPAAKPKPAAAAPTPPAAPAAPDAVEMDAAMEAAEEQVPAEGVEGDAEAVPAVDENETLIEYEAADGSKIPLSGAHVKALIAGTEQALLNEQSAIQAVQQARAEAAQARQQIEQLGAFVRQGNADAILQLLGVPTPASRAAPLQPEATVSAPDFSQVDWSDPAAIQQAFARNQQAMQAQFEGRLQQEAKAREERDRSYAQQQQAQQIVQWGHSVDAYAARTLNGHPAAAKLSPLQMEAAQSQVARELEKALHAGRLSPRLAEQQITAVVQQIVNARVSAWLNDGRQTLGKAVQTSTKQAKTLPKGSPPRVTATTLPSKGLTPMGTTLDEWNRSIETDMAPLLQRSGLE